MNQSQRIRFAVLFLGAALVVQGGLLWHMLTGPDVNYLALRKSFAELPKTVQVERAGKSPMVWTSDVSQYQSKIAEDLPYRPTDFAFRDLYCEELKAGAEWSIIHSKNGEDREHHPEICIRDVLKLPEIVSERAVIDVGDGKEPRKVQRFCFRQGEGRLTTVYYWYYSFTPVADPNRTWLQSLYHSFTGLPPSVTVQVTTSAGKDQRKDIEGDLPRVVGLLRTIDRQLRSEYLPPGVQMDCERLPIGLVTK